MKQFKIPSLKRLLKSKTALGAPVGNLIILVAAVILSTIVVLFAVNLTTNQVQKEKLYIASSHVWYVDSNVSIAAVAISDTGPTDAVLTKINVNGLQCQWGGDTNYIVYCEINGTLPGDLPYVADITNQGNTTVDIAGSPYDFTPANEGLTIQAGTSIAFYIVVPNRVMVYDLAEPLPMVITTTQSVYCTETLVQAA
ncbi:MAG: hypothetical protein M1167_07585 [Chloroflexi bacterium]|nr:hypothetical protein [Chloroflexota bacterium]